MSDIPQARRQLLDLTLELNVAQANRVRAIVEASMHRPAPIRRAPRTSRAITGVIVKAVKREFARRPDASMAEIAFKFRINPGRVSEIMRGDYD